MLNKEKLAKFLADYKDNFDNQWEKENYKWIAIKTFQENWDVNAENFYGMLKTSLSKTENLMISSNYFPAKMILEFAGKHPEQVRNMFRNLFDDSLDLLQRIKNFQDASEKLLEDKRNNNLNQDGQATKQKKAQHYQDERAISVYLWLHNPDKYYLYKFGVSKDVIQAIDAQYTIKKHQKTNILNCFEMYNEINEIIKQDNELVSLVQTHIGPDHYKDTNLKVTTGDFCFFISQKESQNETTITQNKGPNETNHWWLNADPKTWSFSNIPVGNEESYTLRNESGNLRRIPRNFRDAKPGDLVIGYEASPNKKVVALCKITKKDDEKLYFAKIKSLENPIDYQTIKSVPELENLEFFKNPNGSLFKVTPQEYDAIMNIINKANTNIPANTSDAEKYTKQDFLAEVFMTENKYNEIAELLKLKKNIILQGAPGVGKTFTAERLAYSIIGKKDSSRIKFVQFHQNYSYEDFVIGYKPFGDGFKLTHGIFYDFCEKAANDPKNDYFFIIDEINRGNMSKIFGELLMMIESDYRGKYVQLAYSEQTFTVPKNLYIIGMMNTADRSLAMIDYALRRRFSFVNMEPGFETEGFKKYLNANPKFKSLVENIIKLNEKIASDSSLGPGFCIGHSYLCNPERNVDSIINYDLIPLIKEYWFDNESAQKQNIDILTERIK